MNNIKVSIIVPIYNVENYLCKCINSLLNQTYKNIEIILVDDGATDNCPKICDDYKAKDNRIKVIHKKNGGLSDARNCGIDISTGEYIMFVDSDDYVNKDYVKKMLNYSIKNNLDLVISNYFIDDEINITETNFIKDNFIINNEDKYEYLYTIGYDVPTTVAWNKLYKKYIFNDLRYPTGKIHEDEFIIANILQRANRIGYLKDHLYYYLQRNGSITSTFNLKRFDSILALSNRVEFFKSIGRLDLVDKTEYIKLIVIRKNIKLYLNTTNYDKNILEKYKKDFNNSVKKLIHSKSINIKWKIRVIAFYIFPFLMYK